MAGEFQKYGLLIVEGTGHCLRPRVEETGSLWSNSRSEGRLVTRVSNELEIYDVKYMPIVKAYAEKIGLVEVINRLVPSEVGVTPGHMVLAMILDTLTGRSPLHHLKSFYRISSFFWDRGIAPSLSMTITSPGFWTRSLMRAR
jgi:hypothetical protein